MIAGRLRHSIIVEQTTETRTDTGGVTNTWSTFANRRASIRPLTGSEFFDSKQTNSEMTHEIKMRYLSGLTTKMRIKYGTRIFNITSIQDKDERNREIIILAKECD